jgi:hypothetical protein
MRELVLNALRRKLAAAEQDGDTERAERLRQRLGEADVVPANEAADESGDGLDDLSYAALRERVAEAEVVPEGRKKEDLIAALRSAQATDETQEEGS